MLQSTAGLDDQELNLIAGAFGVELPSDWRTVEPDPGDDPDHRDRTLAEYLERRRCLDALLYRLRTHS